MTGRWKTAGPAQVGQLTHRVIADLLRDGIAGQVGQEGWRLVLEAVDLRMDEDGYRDRAARQSVAAAVLGYLSVLPEPPWQFVSAEHRLPGVRLDLLWRHADTGELRAEEIKSGQAGVTLPATRAQVERYLDALRLAAPDQLTSVRAVSTRAPHTSWSLAARPTPNETDRPGPHGRRGPPTD